MRLTVVMLLMALVAANAWADDDVIFDKVRQRLYNDPDVKGARLTIEVKDGVVTLKGHVGSDKFRSKAERLTRKVAGVKNVVNQLTVGEEKPK
jgi:osmotically-inducible protein OsmY